MIILLIKTLATAVSIAAIFCAGDGGMRIPSRVVALARRRASR